MPDGPPLCYTCGSAHLPTDECTGEFNGRWCPSCEEVEIPMHLKYCPACCECDSCGNFGAIPYVREEYVQPEEGLAGYDAPVLIGNLCLECKEDWDGAEPLSDWQ